MFQKFSAIRSRRKEAGGENPNSSVVVEAMKLLPNSSYGYQIMDRIGQTVTKYLSDEKTIAAINSKIFKRLGFIYEQLYEFELPKSEFERKEPKFVGFLFCTMQSWEGLTCITTFSRSIAMLQSMKSYKWIQIRCIQHWQSKICMIVSDQKWKNSG